MPVLALIVFGAWALSSPAGSSPDDDFHQTSIWCAAGPQAGECAPGAIAGQYRVPPLVANSSCFAFKADVSGSCQGGVASTPTTTDRGNFTALYPPFYYGFMHTFVTSDVNVSIVIMRVVNSVIFVALASVLCWLLPHRRRPTLVWTLAITMIPLGLFVVASVNPSSWAITSAALVLLATVGYFETTGLRRIGVAAVATIATFLGAGARADGAVFAVIAVGAAVLLTMRRTRRYWLSAIFAVALVVLAGALFLTGHQSGSALSGGLASGGSGTANWQLWFPILSNLPLLWAGGLGAVFGLGWVDTQMPGMVWVVTIGVFSAVTFAAVRFLGIRKALVLAAAGLALLVIPFYLQVSTGTLVGNQVQPRYVLPLVIIFAAIALWEPDGRRLEFSAAQWWILGAALAVAQAFALHTNLRRYVTGSDVMNFNLSSGVEWWWNIPITPMWLWVLASAACAGLFALIVVEFAPRSIDRTASGPMEAPLATVVR